MYYFAYTEDGLGFRIVLDGWELAPGETTYDHELTEEEKVLYLPLYVPAAWRALQLEARTALVLTDMVAVRCFKAGVQFPQDWWDYVEALRSVVRTRSGDIDYVLPLQPQYPENT